VLAKEKEEAMIFILRHQRSCESHEEKSDDEDASRYARRKTAARSKNCGEESKDIEYEGNKVEDPAKTPQVVVMGAGGALPMRAVYLY
jgi:hypothetical protein